MSGRPPLITAPLITAVVSTYNRLDYLKACLSGLLDQDLDRRDYEIVVVDNNSTDGTAAYLASLGAAASRGTVTAVREARQGVAAARNRGLALARAPLVAFIDDDAIPPRGWLRGFVDAFGRVGPDVAVIGGDCDPIWEAPVPPWLKGRELMAMSSATLGLSGDLRPVTGDEWLFEGNVAYRTAVLREHGGFPESLGRQGNLLISGENTVNRVIEHAGGRLWCHPAIRVRHAIQKDRLTPRWFRCRYFWQGATMVHVERYLRRKGIPYTPRQKIDLPVSMEDWKTVITDDGQGFDPRALSRCFGLGFFLTMYGVLDGTPPEELFGR